MTPHVETEAAQKGRTKCDIGGNLAQGNINTCWAKFSNENHFILSAMSFFLSKWLVVKTGEKKVPWRRHEDHCSIKIVVVVVVSFLCHEILDKKRYTWFSFGEYWPEWTIDNTIMQGYYTLFFSYVWQPNILPCNMVPFLLDWVESKNCQFSEFWKS